MTDQMPMPHRWSLALATDRRLSPTDIAVGRTLALHMDADGGSCYPTHARVAHESHLGEVTVRRAIRRQRTWGWLRQTARSAPGRAAAYEAVIPDIPTEHRYEETAVTTEHRSPRTTVHRSPRPGVTERRSQGTTEHRSQEIRTPVSGDRPGIHEVAIDLSRASMFDDDFARAWAVYPRKVARTAALKAYRARRRAGISADDLLTAATNYAAERAGEDPGYTMHGATFFGPNERWQQYRHAAADVSYEPLDVVYR